MDKADQIERRAIAMRADILGVEFRRRAVQWQRSGLLTGLAFAGLIALMTLLPVAPGVPQGRGLDKLAHFLGFAAMVFPVILTDPRRWFWVVPLAIAYGGAIELVQPSVGRGAEWLDWGADISGVLAGAALGEMLHDRMHRRFVGDLAAEIKRCEVADHAEREEAIRIELIEDLRAVLREELAAIDRNASDAGSDPYIDPTPPPRH